MLHHAIVTTWRGGSSPWPRSIRGRGGSVNSRFDSPELQIKRADTRRLPSSLPPASATLEKARALHVVQDAPAILVLDDHVGDRLYVVMYVLISVSYIFLANEGY